MFTLQRRYVSAQVCISAGMYQRSVRSAIWYLFPSRYRYFSFTPSPINRALVFSCRTNPPTRIRPSDTKLPAPKSVLVLSCLRLEQDIASQAGIYSRTISTKLPHNHSRVSLFFAPSLWKLPGAKEGLSRFFRVAVLADAVMVLVCASLYPYFPPQQR